MMTYNNPCQSSLSTAKFTLISFIHGPVRSAYTGLDQTGLHVVQNDENIIQIFDIFQPQTKLGVDPGFLVYDLMKTVVSGEAAELQQLLQHSLSLVQPAFDFLQIFLLILQLQFGK